MNVDYELTGCANGAPLILTGRGTAEAGSLELTLECERVPRGWDPALALVGGLDPLLLELPEGEPVLGRTRAELLDEQGREVGEIAVAWHAWLDGGVLAVRAQLLRAETRLEVLERVTGVEPYRGVVVPTEGAAVLTSAVAIETGRGSSYRAVAVTRAEAVGAELGLVMDDVRLRREGEAVTVGARVRVEALAVTSP